MAVFVILLRLITRQQPNSIMLLCFGRRSKRDNLLWGEKDRLLDEPQTIQNPYYLDAGKCKVMYACVCVCVCVFVTNSLIASNFICHSVKVKIIAWQLTLRCYLANNPFQNNTVLYIISLVVSVFRPVMLNNLWCITHVYH